MPWEREREGERERAVSINIPREKERKSDENGLNNTKFLLSHLH